MLSRVLCFGVVLFSVTAQAEWREHQFEVMGTRASVSLWSPSEAEAQSLFQLVEQEMRRIDALMSPYIDSSELSAVNRLSVGETRVLSDELFTVLDKAMQFSTLSDGAFDVSFASVGKLYNYRESIQPNANQLVDGLSALGYQYIELNRDSREIRFLRNGMQIDLGGIAKGYAVDRSIEQLRMRGVQSALVSAGGDSRMLGDRGPASEGGRLPWVIGIQHPRDNDSEALRLPLSNTAVSTSGDYRRYFMQGKQRVHHILNPQTGRPANGVVSATVIGPTSMSCDALSTTLFVLGVESGLQFIEKFAAYDAVIIDDQGVVHFSNGLSPN